MQLQNTSFEGKQILVAEHNVSLGHCFLPCNAAENAVRRHAMLNDTSMCGRGIVAAEKFVCGQMVFEEHPFLISPSGTTQQWRSRWKAYFATLMAAEKDKAVNCQVKDIFDNLSTGSDERKKAIR